MAISNSMLLISALYCDIYRAMRGRRRPPEIAMHGSEASGGHMVVMVTHVIWVVCRWCGPCGDVTDPCRLHT